MLFSAPSPCRRFSSVSSFRAISFRSLVMAALFAAISVAAHGQTATTTTLAVTSGGNAVTTVTSGSVVTLTATVAAGSTPVTVGQVNFCDASAAYCTDIHLLATAQLTSAGTATYKFRPGVGSHSYKAVFLGTPHGATNYAGSASGAMALSVTGLSPTVTVLQATTKTNSSPYSLMATVGSIGKSAPSGTVSFINTTTGNTVLDTATLTAGTAGLGFLSPQSPPTGLGPYAIGVGDFNQDGIPDLAVTNINAFVGDSNLGTVTVLLGSGDGMFTAVPISPTVGQDPESIAVGDFNGDGIPDLVVANYNYDIEDTDPPGGTVTVLLGKGDGTFTTAPIQATGNNPTAVAVGDFNGDGIADLAVANSSDDTVSVLLGNGDGTFTPKGPSPASPNDTGDSPISIAVADFNGDGVPDLAVANTVVNTVTILLGNGNGTFTPSAASPATGNTPLSIVSGDFNGDGVADLAVANSVDNTVTMLLGNGNGTFTAGATLQTDDTPDALAVGDLNSDGIADLVVANYTYGTVNVFLGNGNGTFTASGSNFLLGGSAAYPTSIALGDFNGDGAPDLAISNYQMWSSVQANWFYASVSVNQTATATVSGITPPPGTNLVDASYAGDSNYKPSLSRTASLLTLRSYPTATLTPASSTVTTAQPLAVTVVVTGLSGGPMPTGTVTLTGSNYNSGPTALDNGNVAFNIPAGSLVVGVYSLTAVYSGDANYYGAQATAQITVNPAPFTISGTSVLVPAAGTNATSSVTITPAGGFTGSVALTAAVTSSPAGATSLPTLSFGSTSPVSITGTSAGTATLTVSTTAATTPGVYEVTVTGTSGNVTATTSVPVTVPVGAAAAAVTVTPSLTPITNEQAETVAVSVAGGSGQATPTGTVTLASGSYSAQQALASGAASFSVPAGTLGAGANTLTATYSGDGMYAGAMGTATVTVSQAVMAIPTPASVAPGASATATATLNAGSTYSGTMNLTCSLTTSPAGAQSLPTCSLSPASVTLAAGGSGTATLTVKTTVESTTTSSNTTVPPSGTHPWRLDGGLALAGVLVLALPFRRRRWLTMLAVVWLAVGAFAVGCGGGSSNTSPVTTTTPATTAGNYIFKVTGTDSSNTTVTASASVTVTVQ